MKSNYKSDANFENKNEQRNIDVIIFIRRQWKEEDQASQCCWNSLEWISDIYNSTFFCFDKRSECVYFIHLIILQILLDKPYVNIMCIRFYVNINKG